MDPSVRVRVSSGVSGSHVVTGFSTHRDLVTRGDNEGRDPLISTVEADGVGTLSLGTLPPTPEGKRVFPGERTGHLLCEGDHRRTPCEDAGVVEPLVFQNYGLSL